MPDALQQALIFCYTESSLHAGTGSAVSAIDLPIQRERTTNFPIVQGSGVKGALRGEMRMRFPEYTKEVDAIFGPEVDKGSETSKSSEADKDKKHAGAVSFSEARIVLFPVRSLRHTFAYVASPYAIARLVREATQAGIMHVDEAQQFASIKEPAENGVWVVHEAASIVDKRTIVLEEYTFEAARDDKVAKLADWLALHAFPQTAAYAYWRDNLKQRLVVVSDSTFTDFVTNSTEITTHVRLVPESKTVDGSALWTSESLPPETLLFVSVTAHSVRAPSPPESLGKGTAGEALHWLSARFTDQPRIQLGGDETTGQGIVAVTWQLNQ